MFEAGVVRANELISSVMPRRHTRDIFSIFYNKVVCCLFSNYIPLIDTIFKIKKENHPKLSHICSYGIFSKGLKSEFETAVVNEPSVFEPLKFYCML